MVVEYRLRFGKEGNFKFYSHLELIKTMERALRRAKIPMAYSEGYHPHPKLGFGPALAVGLCSIDEYFDVELTEEWAPEALPKALNPVLPQGLHIFAACRCLDCVKPLNAVINRAAYLLELEVASEEMNLFLAQLDHLLKEAELWVVRTSQKNSKKVNIRPWLHSIKIETAQKNSVTLRVEGETGSNGNLRPEDLLALLTHPVTVLNIVRVGLWHERNGITKKPFDFCEKAGG